ERLREIAAATAAVERFRASSGGPHHDWMDEVDAKDMLRADGLPVPAGMVVASEEECAAAAEELGGRVALKLASPGLLHKSDADALRLDLEGDEATKAAYRELSTSVAAAGARILVERMEPPGVELVVGARTDAIVPALIVGLGGIWTEALDDV